MDCLVTFLDDEGHQVRCTVVRLARRALVFQVLDPQLDLRTSKVLDPLTVLVGFETAYQGKTVVTGLVDTGHITLCEVELEEPGLNLPEYASNGTPPNLRAIYHDFVQAWQKHYCVRTEFKTIVADLQSYLSELRLWANQVELRLPTRYANVGLPDETLMLLGQDVVGTIDRMHDRFEEVAGSVEAEDRPAHRHFARQLLSPFFLCTPFGYRSFQKPLGYAGDYELMNMIHRQAPEGPDLFSRLVHYWLVRQWPAQSVRNRVAHLESLVTQTAARAHRNHRRARVLSLGCGPAREIENVVRASPLANHLDVTLLDFDQAPLDFAERSLTEACRHRGRTPRIQTRRLSAQHLLRLAAGGQRVADRDDRDYDLIYCAGLFDYLADAVCRQLVSVFYDWTAPGGRVVVSNMDDCKPFRSMMEFLLDWHLIYRRGPELLEFRPPEAPLDQCVVRSEPTSVNHFLEVTKPGARPPS